MKLSFYLSYLSFITDNTNVSFVLRFPFGTKYYFEMVVLYKEDGANAYLVAKFGIVFTSD